MKRIALGLKEAYGCNGNSTRRHNEDAGNQKLRSIFRGQTRV